MPSMTAPLEKNALQERLPGNEASGERIKTPEERLEVTEKQIESLKGALTSSAERFTELVKRDLELGSEETEEEQMINTEAQLILQRIDTLKKALQVAEREAKELKAEMKRVPMEMGFGGPSALDLANSEASQTEARMKRKQEREAERAALKPFEDQQKSDMASYADRVSRINPYQDTAGVLLEQAGLNLQTLQEQLKPLQGEDAELAEAREAFFSKEIRALKDKQEQVAYITKVKSGWKNPDPVIAAEDARKLAEYNQGQENAAADQSKELLKREEEQTERMEAFERRIGEINSWDDKAPQEFIQAKQIFDLLRDQQLQAIPGENTQQATKRLEFFSRAQRAFKIKQDEIAYVEGLKQGKVNADPAIAAEDKRKFEAFHNQTREEGLKRYNQEENRIQESLAELDTTTRASNKEFISQNSELAAKEAKLSEAHELHEAVYNNSTIFNSISDEEAARFDDARAKKEEARRLWTESYQKVLALFDAKDGDEADMRMAELAAEIQSLRKAALVKPAPVEIAPPSPEALAEAKSIEAQYEPFIKGSFDLSVMPGFVNTGKQYSFDQVVNGEYERDAEAILDAAEKATNADPTSKAHLDLVQQSLNFRNKLLPEYIARIKAQKDAMKARYKELVQKELPEAERRQSAKRQEFEVFSVPANDQFFQNGENIETSKPAETTTEVTGPEIEIKDAEPAAQEEVERAVQVEAASQELTPKAKYNIQQRRNALARQVENAANYLRASKERLAFSNSPESQFDLNYADKNLALQQAKGAYNNFMEDLGIIHHLYDENGELKKESAGFVPPDAERLQMMDLGKAVTTLTTELKTLVEQNKVETTARSKTGNEDLAEAMMAEGTMHPKNVPVKGDAKTEPVAAMPYERTQPVQEIDSDEFDPTQKQPPLAA